MAFDEKAFHRLKAKPTSFKERAMRVIIFLSK
jgi:hypothetical protein